MRKKHGRYYRRTWLTYFLLLLIPLTALFFAYSWKTGNDNALRAQTQRIQDAKEAAVLLDSKLQGIDNIGWQIFNSNWGKRLRSSSDIMFDYFTIFHRADVSNEITGYQMTIEVAKQLSIYLPRRELVIAPSGWWKAGEYLNFMQIDTPEKQVAFKSAMDSNTMTLQFIHTEALGIYSDSSDPLLISRSLDDTGKGRSSMAIFLSKHNIKLMLEQVAGGRLSQLSIHQGEQKIYQYDAEPASEKQQRTQAFTIPSSIFQGSYQINVQYGNVFIPLEHPPLIIGAIVVILLFTWAASMLLARISYRPIALLMVRMGLDRTVVDWEFRHIELTIEELEQQKRDYHQMARSHLLRSLLSGDYEDTDIQHSLEEFSIPFTDESNFLVAILSLGERLSLQQDTDQYLSLQELLSAGEYHYELIFEPSRDRAVIFYAKDIDPCVCEKLLSDVAGYMLTQSKIHMMHHLGSVQSGLKGIAHSYAQALKASQMRYYYPTGVEIQLIHYVSLGQEKLALKILEELKEKNAQRRLPDAAQERLFTLLSDTLLRVMSELSLPVEGLDQGMLSLNESSELRWQRMEKWIVNICKKSSVLHGDSDNGSANELIQYVQNEYHRQDLSLKMLSEHFHYSIATINRLFKSSVNMTFYDYLTQLRLDRAKELLMQQREKADIATIAMQVGYASAPSFIRAFRRREGIHPRECAQAYGFRR